MTRARSRLLILSHVAQFGLVRATGDGHTWGSSTTNFREGGQVGDLVAIQCASPSKWYLSWVYSIQRPEGWGCDQYTLESIEDGELCNWTNIGLIHLNREEFLSHPEWKWSDEQHEFKDKWFKAAYKRCDAYLHLPLHPVFDGGSCSVDLGLRARFGLCDPSRSIKVDNFKKATLKSLVAIYQALSGEMTESKKRLQSNDGSLAPTTKQG